MDVNKIVVKALLGGALIGSVFFFSQEKAGVNPLFLDTIISGNNQTNLEDDGTEDTIQQLLEGTHPAGDDFGSQNRQARLETLCSRQSQLCDITSYNGVFSDQEKFIYQSIIIYLIRRIDTFLTTSQKVSTTLSTLTINKDNEGRRGYAGHQTIVVNLSSIKGYKEFMEILAHEIGHIVDLGIIEGRSPILDKNYTEFNAANFGIDDPSLSYYKISWIGENTRTDESSPQDFVSGYGMTNTFEDFAEAHNLYLMHNALFREMTKDNSVLAKKYSFLSNLYGGKFIFAGRSNIVKLASNADRRPWDTTRIR